MKEQESKKIASKWSDSKVHPESPSATQKSGTTNDHERNKSATVAKKISPPSNVSFPPF